MADGITVEIKGLDELDKTLRAFPEELQGAPVRAALKAGAMVVQDGMQRRAPRDPRVQNPTLAEDIGFKVFVSNKRNEAYAHIGPEKQVFYGGFLELGTSKMAARPSFMRAALDEDKHITIAAFANEMRRAIDRLAKRYYKRMMTGRG